MARSAGVVEQTTIRKEVVPAAELGESTRQTPEFWAFIESLSPEMWVSGNYELAILREDPKPSNYGGTNTLEKCQGTLEVRPGVSIPLDSREDIELAIRQKYGGRAFRLILKRGKERITEGKCINEAPPKDPYSQNPNYMGPLGTGVQQSPTDASAAAAIGSKAIDALSGQESAAINVAVNALKGASEVISNLLKPQQSTTNNLIETETIKGLIQKALNPPPPPDLLKLITDVKTLFAHPATNTVKEVVDTIAALKTAGLIPAGGDRTNMGIELARQIPNVTSAAKDAIHEWRLGVEAQERTAAVMRGGVPPPAASANYNPPAAPRAVAAAVPPATAPPQDAAHQEEVSLDPPIEWVEHKLVSILKKNLPVSETVDNVLDFLEDAAPGMIPELLTAGERMIAAGVIPASATPAEAGILHLFQTRPILQQIPVNPRLVEFIKSFVENAKNEPAPPQPAENIG